MTNYICFYFDNKKNLTLNDLFPEYRFISLTDIAKEIIRKARELNPDGKFIFERNGERLTARAEPIGLEYIAEMQELHRKVLIAQEGQLQVA